MINRKQVKSLVFLLLFLFISSCGGIEGSGELDIPGVVTDVSTASYALIVMGDDFAAGDQDAVVHRYTQIKSFPTLIATQLAKLGNVYYTEPLLEVTGARADETILPTNVAVSGDKSADILSASASAETISAASSAEEKALYPIQSPSYRGEATSQLDAALYMYQQIKTQSATIPVIIVLSAGANDVMEAVKADGSFTESGISANMTSADDFRSSYDEILSTLTGQTDATIVVSNIFDITDTAYLLTKSDFEFYIGQATSSSNFVSGDSFGLNTFVTELYNIDRGRTFDDYLSSLLRDEYVLSEVEAALISARVTELNAIISELATTYGVTLVDVATPLASVLNGSSNVTSNNTVDKRWGRGGAFSLDGVHFSDTVNGLVANYFIESMNTALGITIASVDLDDLYSSDSYRDRDSDGYVYGPNWTALDDSDAEILHYFIDQDDRDEDTVYRNYDINEDNQSDDYGRNDFMD